MRNYMKKKQEQVEMDVLLEEDVVNTEEQKVSRFNKKTAIIAVATLFVAVPLVCAITSHGMPILSAKDDGLMQLESAPIAAASGKKGVIEIPAGTTKANPFLPYRDLGGTSRLDVPAYNLVEPPEIINEGSDAARVMDTIVSGILYDKYSPSAILNIEGNDYLVKKGDTVNNYKIVSIAQDSVTVKLGNNVYSAGIGEILTEGSINHNEVSNLSNKFGGER